MTVNSLLQIEPYRCEAISLAEFERESLKLVELLEHLAVSFGPRSEEREWDEAEASRWREFRE